MRSVQYTTLRVNVVLEQDWCFAEVNVGVMYDDQTSETRTTQLDLDDVEGWEDLGDLARQILVNAAEKL